MGLTQPCENGVIKGKPLNDFYISNQFKTKGTTDFGVHVELGQTVLAESVTTMDHNARKPMGQIIGRLAQNTAV